MKRYALGITLLVGILNFFVGVPVALANTYAIWDSANTSGVFSLSGVSLIATHTGGNAWGSAHSNICVSSGKWYWETKLSSINTGAAADSIGIYISTGSNTVEFDDNLSAEGWGYRTNGTIVSKQVSKASGLTTYDNNDVIGVAYDAGAGTISWYKNNSLVNTQTAVVSAGTFCASAATFLQNAVMTANFGPSTANTPPSGYNQGLYTAPAAASFNPWQMQVF